MKKRILLSIITWLIMCLCASAQNTFEGTIVLRSGGQVTGTVETQADGSVKVVTAIGDVFYFSDSEISNIVSANSRNSRQDRKEAREAEREMRKSNSATIEQSEQPAVNQSVSSFYGATPEMIYSQYERLYTASSYTRHNDDVYSPGLATFLSCMVPGVGQMYTGRLGSGLAFVAFEGACGFLVGIGLSYCEVTKNYGYNTYYDYYYPYRWMAYVGLGGAVICHVWSALNANKVAKIKNLYYRDLRSMSSLQLDIKPYFGQMGTLAMQPVPVTGLTLQLSF